MQQQLLSGGTKKRGRSWKALVGLLTVATAMLLLSMGTYTHAGKKSLSLTRQASTTEQTCVSQNFGFDPEEHVVADIRPALAAMQFHDGVNPIYTFADGSRLSARVKKGKIVDRIATDSRGRALMVDAFKKLIIETHDNRHEELILRMNSKLDTQPKEKKEQFDKAVEKASNTARRWLLKCYLCVPQGCIQIVEFW